MKLSSKFLANFSAHLASLKCNKIKTEMGKDC